MEQDTPHDGILYKFTHVDHVPDPYYGGSEGFEYVLDILEDACAGLLQSI